MTNCVHPSPSQETGSPHEPIFVNVYENSLGRAPVSSIQTMEQDDPIAHRLDSASQTSTSGRCKANLAKLKEDLAGHNEVKLSDLSSVRQGQNESVLDYFQRFKAIKNRCFNLTISEKDLANLAYNGLRSYLKEKLDGFDFITVNHLQMRAIGLEFKFKNEKDTFETHQSIHIDGKSNSNDEKKEVAEFIWPSEAKPCSCSSLKPIPKNRQEQACFTFDVSKCNRILMNCLEVETSSCLMPYRRLRS